MPGRVTTRAARSSAAANRTTGQSARSRAASAVQIPDEGPDTSLRKQICAIFQDAQRNITSQRKLVVNLRKIQEACCYEPENPKKSVVDEDFDEQDFNDEIGRCIKRILWIKKTEPVGHRLVRFLALFLRHSVEKDDAIMQGDPEASEPQGTPARRLVHHIVALVIPFLTAKDKVVRYRSTQIIQQVVNMVDSIDEEYFHLIRLGLLKRVHDKENAVRSQAVLGLGPLAGELDEEEEDSDDDEASGGVLRQLVEALQHDPSAEVRRSLLRNLAFTPHTLPLLLERARDCDPSIRRLVYTWVLPHLGDFRGLSLTHREKLLRWGLRDRDEHVRKAAARLFYERWIEDCAASHRENEDGAVQPPNQISPPSMPALLELVERIDVINNGIEYNRDGNMEHGIPFDAMQVFWAGRPDYVEFVTFDEEFWKNLEPEGAFIARTFNDYCRSSASDKTRDLLEDKMPEVSAFAYLLKEHLNKLIEGLRKAAERDAEEDADNDEDDTAGPEFCVEQLLHIALTLDYSDEIGRRNMFTVMREALALPELPEECTRLVADVLRITCGNGADDERQFCSIVTEAIAEVHDTIMVDEEVEGEDDDDEESFHSAQSELSEINVSAGAGQSRKNKTKKGPQNSEEEEQDEERAIREIMVNLKCLNIAEYMLQNITCDLESQHTLVTMLNNLVVPAVRSNDAPIRESGLRCLGLCCYLSENLAKENLNLFLHCFKNGHQTLQTISLEVITDIVCRYPRLLAPPPADASTTEPLTPAGSEPVNPNVKPLTKMFLRALANPHPSPLPVLAAKAGSKLLLNSMLPTAAATDLLKAFILSYFSPETTDNVTLRQILSYVIPTYCHSLLSRAEHMATVTVPIISKLVGLRDELQLENAGADEAMVSWAVLAGMFAEWTDGRRVVGMIPSTTIPAAHNFLSAPQPEDVGMKEEALHPHIILARAILEKIGTATCSREERKPLFSLLAKLHVLPSPTGKEAPRMTDSLNEMLTELLEYVEDVERANVAPDAVSRNAITKLAAALTKVLGSPPDGEIETAQNQEPEDAISGAEDAEKTTAADQEERQTSAVPTEQESVAEEEIDEEASGSETPKPNRRAPPASTGRRGPRASASATSASPSVDERHRDESEMPSPAPRSIRAKRAAATRKSQTRVSVSVTSEDEKQEEEDEDSEESALSFAATGMPDAEGTVFPVHDNDSTIHSASGTEDEGETRGVEETDEGSTIVVRKPTKPAPPAAPQPRKRGRPSNAAVAAAAAAALSAPAPASPAPRGRGRGRPRGSGTKTSAPSAPTAPRGRGRPRKNAQPVEDSVMESLLDSD